VVRRGWRELDFGRGDDGVDKLSELAEHVGDWPLVQSQVGGAVEDYAELKRPLSVDFRIRPGRDNADDSPYWRVLFHRLSEVEFDCFVGRDVARFVEGQVDPFGCQRGRWYYPMFVEVREPAQDGQRMKPPSTTSRAIVRLIGAGSRSRSAPIDPGRAAYVLDALAAGVTSERIALELAVELKPRERLALRAFASDSGVARAAVAAQLGMPRNAVTRAWQGAFRRMVAPVRLCAGCGEPLDPRSRSDRRFCKWTCRVAFGVTKPTK
jgi:hypothetical protein